MKKFEVGKTYICKSVCDANAKWEYVVIARTEKTITLRDELGNEEVKRIKRVHGEEIAYPNGKYSMCPVLRAGSEVA